MIDPEHAPAPDSSPSDTSQAPTTDSSETEKPTQSETEDQPEAEDRPEAEESADPPVGNAPTTDESEPPASAEVESVIPSETPSPELESTTNEAIAPMALTGNDCSYADPGTGAYAQTLCWLDFTGFTTRYQRPHGLSTQWQSVMGYDYTDRDSVSSDGWFSTSGWGHVQDVPVIVDLGYGYTLTATLGTSSDGTASGKAVTSESFPTYDQAFLGNRVNEQRFYTGVTGSPALHQAKNGGSSTITLNNILVQDPDGIVVSDYSIVVADAESTDSGEEISWSTTGAGFRWLPNSPPVTQRSDVMGNACATTTPDRMSINAFQNASCSGGSGQKTGTAMLATEPPANINDTFSVTQTLTGNGRQGVSFGVIMARTAVEVNVSDRIVDNANTSNDSTIFSAEVRAAGNSKPLATASTGPTELESGEENQVLPVSSNGTQLEFEAYAEGELASSYIPTWQCEKTDPITGETDTWTDSGQDVSPPEDFARLSVGQFMRCSVSYAPPYLSLLKNVENHDTDATHTAVDFTLTAEGNNVPSRITGTGNGPAEVSQRPVAVGQYALAEDAPDPADGSNWQYGYDWTDLRCEATPGSDSTAPGDLDTTRNANREITEAALEIRAGNDITCTYENTARAPQVQASKDAFAASGDALSWGEAVQPGDTVQYQLSFDNAAGTAPMELSYVDYLADVLDDADYVSGSLRISDGQESGYPSASIQDPDFTVEEQVLEGSPQLIIDGVVDRGQVRTVWFEVEVLANADNAEERQQGPSRDVDDAPSQVGYSLNNYLVPAGEPVPDSCGPTEDEAVDTCTHHPIPAWSLDKNSRPADGARLHSGGNTHYQITAAKMNAATNLDGLVFTDDLTHVFKTAGWAPDAAVPGGALPRGIYFFDDDGQPLNADGDPADRSAEGQPLPAYGAETVPVPEQVDGRWLLTTQPVDLPDNAMRAELWFAVEAGQRPADVPAEWSSEGEPRMGWQYVNYVTADSQQTSPNQCGTADTPVPDTGIAASAAEPADTQFPAACRTTHQLSENYFTIRKDAAGAGIEPVPGDSAWGDETGLTNMVGHEFEIRDDVDGKPSSYPSMKLCREEYHPDIWDGEFITGGTPDWAENSETLEAILAHNNSLDIEEDPLPVCGLLYPQGTYGGQDHAGGQDGRWRSEHLTEGKYWLVETRAPAEQIDTTGSQNRDVEGVQLLADPIPFRIWQDEPGDSFGATGQSMYGQGQLDIASGDGSYLDRCSPGAKVGTRPVACVNPTGYLMMVKDAAPMRLPFTGGQWTGLLMGAGFIFLMSALVGAQWWRNRKRRDT
jgi:hypothetical protein